MKYICKLCLIGCLALSSAAINAELYTFSYAFDASVRGTPGHTLSGVVDGTLLEDRDTIVINHVISASLAGISYDITSDIEIRAEDPLHAPVMSLSGDKIDFWVCVQGFTQLGHLDGGDCSFGNEGGFLISDSFDFRSCCDNGSALAGIPEIEDIVNGNNRYRDFDAPINKANWVAEPAAVSRISFSYSFDATPGHVLEGEVSGVVLDDEDTVLVLEVREAFLDGIDYNVDKHGAGIRAIDINEAPLLSLSGDVLSLWVCPQGFTGIFRLENVLGDCPFGAEGGFLVSSDSVVFGEGAPGTVLGAGRAHAGIPELGDSYRDSDQPINIANWTAVVTKIFKPKLPKKPKKDKNK